MRRLIASGTWPQVGAKDAKALYEEMHKTTLTTKDKTHKKLKKDLENAKARWRSEHPQDDAEYEAALARLKQHACYKDANREKLLGRVAALQRSWWAMYGEFAEAQEQLRLAREKSQRLQVERDAAIERVAETLDAVAMIQDGVTRLDRMQEREVVPDWDERLRVYLEEIRQQKDAATTLRNRRNQLTPWVRWLKKNGGRASNQRIKMYLKSRGNLRRTSYQSIGKVIEDFCNDTADFEWERVRCPRAHGHLREKPTLAMPAEVLDAVSKLVAARTLKFGSKGQDVTTKKEATQLGKDLGK